MLAGSLLVAGGAVAASGFDTMPGSADDPLVTKSFVEQLIDARLKGKAPSSAPAAPAAPANPVTPVTPVQTGGGASAAEINVAPLEPGQKIIGYAGTQFIVRSGKVKVVAGENRDGFPDLTGGFDVQGGQIVGPNHLLLIPKSDGRGLVVAPDSKTAYVMIIGTFHVE